MIHTLPSVVTLKHDGSVFVLFELQGIELETLEDWLIAERQQRLKHTFCQIAHETFTLTFWQHRGPAPPGVYPDIPADSSFSQALNLGYKARLYDQSLYSNRTFLGVQARPSTYKRATNAFLRLNRAQQADEDQLHRLDNMLTMSPRSPTPSRRTRCRSSNWRRRSRPGSPRI